MRLSMVADRLFDAIEERLEPEQRPNIGYAKGLFRILMQKFGDLELNVRIERVPAQEVVDVEGQETK